MYTAQYGLILGGIVTIALVYVVLGRAGAVRTEIGQATNSYGQVVRTFEGR